MKWYLFTQNNSGGWFMITDTLCRRLFIQAESLDNAIDKAESLGCYWNGVDCGYDCEYDCECCGDRWYPPYGPVECQEKTIEVYAQKLADEYGWTKPDARLFYSDGKVVEIFSKKKSLNKD